MAETSEPKTKCMFLVSSSFLWGEDLYERVYWLLGHTWPHCEIFEARFQPDQLANSHLVVVVPTVEGTASRAVWDMIRAAKSLRRKIVLASITEDDHLSIVPLEAFHPKLREDMSDHYVVFNKRSKPRPSSLRSLRDTERSARSMRV